MKKGQLFYMSSKITPVPRLFKYLGINNSCTDPVYNHVVIEVSTNKISHIELQPWLENRIIKEVR